MEWIIELLPVFLPLIMECINRDGEEATINRLRKRPALVQWRVYRAARKSGCSRSCARDHAKEAAQFVKESNANDLLELVAEAKEQE